MSEVWLVGGWAIGRGWWRPTVAVLEAAGIASVTIELNDLGVDPAAWSSELAARLRQCPAPPAVVGWSMGAMVALDALTRPGAPAVAALLVLAGTLRFCAAPDWPLGRPISAVRALRRAVLRDATRALAAFYRDVAAGGGPPQPPPPPAGSTADRLAAALDVLATLDLRDREAPSCPLGWLHGELDAVIPASAGIESARRLGAVARVIAGAGHALPWTCGENVRDVLVCKLSDSQM
ncbi:MAG: alpha/beta hydrolase [Kiritimatiellae bacterium]|nr:alpha/beta hydrolase [Kiritimatiellia bacterium]